MNTDARPRHIQPKLRSNLLACERWTALFESRFGEAAVFEVFQIALDQLAGEITLGVSRELCKFGQSPLDIFSRMLLRLQAHADQVPALCNHLVRQLLDALAIRILVEHEHVNRTGS